MEESPREFNERTKNISCLLFAIFSGVEGYILFSLKNYPYFYIGMLIFVILICLVVWISEKTGEKN